MTMTETFSRDEAIAQAQSYISGDYTALVLFGSYARGDPGGSSDIDVLQVVREQRPSYRVGLVNVSVYTEEHLLAMADRGSLFVLHLLREGVVIYDPGQFLTALRSRFRQPESYEQFRKEVCAASALLDVDEDTYLRRWSGLYALADNLLRSLVYSLAHDKGETSFSLTRVSRFLGDERIVHAHEIRERAASTPDLNAYREMKDLISYYCGGESKNPFGSIEALIVNSLGVSDLTVVLGLRLLNESGAPIAYEEFAQTIGI